MRYEPRCPLPLIWPPSCAVRNLLRSRPAVARLNDRSAVDTRRQAGEGAHQARILKCMATITRTILIDDIQGSEAVETLQFNADGTNYEIDLSTANADRLRAQLARFVAAATPIKPPKTSPVKRSAKSPATSNKLNCKPSESGRRRQATKFQIEAGSRRRSKTPTMLSIDDLLTVDAIVQRHCTIASRWGIDTEIVGAYRLAYMP